MRFVSAVVLAVGALLAPASNVPEGVDAPRPYVRATSSGAYYIKVVPDREGGGTCTAYQATAASLDPVLWSLTGWFSFGLQLSDDGQYLVRYGDARKADAPLVVFYKAGKLVAQYTARDLLADPAPPADVEECVFSYLKGNAQFMGASSFRVVTIEGVECTFDYRTGKLLSKLGP